MRWNANAPRLEAHVGRLLALAALGLATLAACSEDTPTLTEADPLAELTIRTEDVSLEVFGTDTLVAEARRESGRLFDDPDVEWRSFRDQVATIDESGVVTGHAIGEALFTASFGQLTARVAIQVWAPAEARLTLSPDSVLLGEGGRLQLSGTLAMPDGREVPGAGMRWSTAQGAAVAAVSATGVVSALGRGFAVLRAESEGRKGKVPVKVTFGWKEVLPSERHTCAIRADGRAYCWGVARLGRLGIGAQHEFDPRTATAPFPVAGDHRFKSLTLGQHHTCGIDLDGIAWCWGLNSTGAAGTRAVDATCGRGEGECLSTPFPIESDDRFVNIHAGEDHTCAVGEDGLARCWGRNFAGQVGVPPVDEPIPEPTLTALRQEVTAVVTGSWTSSYGLTSDGRAFVWGSHPWSVAEEDVEDPRCSEHRCYLPRAVPGGSRFEGLTAGYRWTCGKTASAEVFCWGVGRPDPAPLGLSRPVVELGRGHMAFWLCAITDDRAGRCWGIDERPGIPFQLAGDLNLKSVASGAGYFSRTPGVCAVTTTNLGYCWTWGSDGDPRDAQPELLPEPVELP